ncbi:hypothetical protein D9T17_08975 [Lysobacter enzymogenes]|uniref:Uncharacterized protein n=1 Tax=Lysobacter enzymogenes TaxID=69 RepID=A0A3N2RJ00_LYSEN|nr:hypothetical protein D9T17_08975 [Lysobacter enzymogenes]
MGDALELIRANPGSPGLRLAAAAHGMALQAFQAVGTSGFFEDARFVVDQLARAKAELDIAAWHSAEVIETTAAILQVTQRFLDEQTIACTEWPAPAEVAACALQAARERIGA